MKINPITMFWLLGVLFPLGGCRTVDEDKLRKIVREEVRREVDKRLRSKAEARRPPNRLPATPPPGTLGPIRSKRPSPGTPRLEHQREYVRSLAQRIEQYKRDGSRTPGQIARMQRALQRSRKHLAELSASAGPASGSSTCAKSSKADAPWLAEVARKARRTGPGKYTVHQTLLARLITQQGAVVRDGRILPHAKNGMPHGFRLACIRPQGLFGALGFKDGDVIVKVNGMDVTSADKALEAFVKLRGAKALTIGVVRNNKAETVQIQVKPQHTRGAKMR